MKRKLLEIAEGEKKQILEMHKNYQSLLMEDNTSQMKVEVMKSWKNFPDEDKKKFKKALRACKKEMGLNLIFPKGFGIGLLVFGLLLNIPMVVGMGITSFGLSLIPAMKKKEELLACVKSKMETVDVSSENIDISSPDDSVDMGSSEVDEEITFDFN